MTQASAPEQLRSGALDLCAPDARKYILVSAILASALGFIDGSMVAIALPAIRGSIDASLVQAQWVSNAYMLTLSALILAAGAAGDRFGLVRIFSTGIVIFVVASLGCALASTVQTLIFARGVQGLGASMMVPGSLALISRAYPRAERGRAIGIWAASAAVTAGLGPIIGGLALTLGGSETWRWIFAINLPLGALALYMLWSHVDQDPAQPERGIDWPGAALATLGLGLIALALSGSEYGNLFTFKSGTYGLIGLISLFAFLRVQAISPNPMMPLSLFKNAGFSSANLISFLVYFAFSSILFYLPMAVIGGWGVSELEAAAAYAPLSVFIAALSGASGKLADKWGPAPLMAAGSLVLAFGYGSLAMVIPTQNYWGAVIPAMCLQGIGMGLIVAPMSSAVMGSVGSDSSGTASGINNAVTRMAGLIAVAAMGSVVSVIYGKYDGPTSFGALEQGAAHQMASESAFSAVAWTACIICLLSCLTAVLAPLRRKRMNR